MEDKMVRLFAGFTVRAMALAALGGLALGVFAAEPTVPYVPTPQEVVDKMLSMAKVTPNDFLIDLGSGDGRIVVTAAKKHGARGFGVDLNPVRIREAVENAMKNGVSDRAEFYQRNLFETDLAPASVITMYLLPRVNMELRPRLLNLQAGTRIVSHDFDMDDWKADETVHLEVKEKYGSAGGTSSVYFWVVPAKVAGNWNWEQSVGGKPQNLELALEQKFQVIGGMLRVNGNAVKIADAKLRGDHIAFSAAAPLNGVAVKMNFSGRVSGDNIFGSVVISGARGQSQLEWTATRGAKTGALPVESAVAAR
jgi:hypothetical protein